MKTNKHAITQLMKDLAADEQHDGAQHDDALASMFDAGATRVPPWMALVASLASVRPDGIGATIDWLVGAVAEILAFSSLSDIGRSRSCSTWCNTAGEVTILANVCTWIWVKPAP